jgi:hypothetical protein
VYPWIAQDSAGVDAYNVAFSYIEELVEQCITVQYGMEDLMHLLSLFESHKEAKCFLLPGKDLKELPPA